MYHHGDKKSKYWTVGPSPHPNNHSKLALTGQTRNSNTLNVHCDNNTGTSSYFFSLTITRHVCGKEEEESESSASILINSYWITRPCSILRKLLCRLRHLLMVKWLAEGDGDVLRRVWGNFFEFSKSHSNCGSDLMNTHKSRAKGATMMC